MQDESDNYEVCYMIPGHKLFEQRKANLNCMRDNVTNLFAVGLNIQKEVNVTIFKFCPMAERRKINSDFYTMQGTKIEKQHSQAESPSM